MQASWKLNYYLIINLLLVFYKLTLLLRDICRSQPC